MVPWIGELGFEGGGYGLHVQHDPGEINPSANVVGNVFHHVEGLHGDEDDAVEFERGPDENVVYFDDNIVPPGESDDQSSGGPLVLPPHAAVTRWPADTLHTRVVPHVGTHHRTAVEQTLLDTVAAEL